jgi:hypothetical protein
VDTLIQHPASLSHRIVGEDDRHGAGVTDKLIRLSAGLEAVEDLWQDLSQALKACWWLSRVQLSRSNPRHSSRRHRPVPRPPRRR